MYAQKEKKQVKLSMCDMLKIGIGSSSSHALAPWLAARDAINELNGNLKDLIKIQVKLYGSLSFGGRGHYTTVAIPLGLSNQNPNEFNIDKNLQNILPEVEDITSIAKLRHIELDNRKVDYELQFDKDKDFKKEKMDFSFFFKGNPSPQTVSYYSYGGGSYGKDPEPRDPYGKELNLKYKYRNATKLLNDVIDDKDYNTTISSAIFENEKGFCKYRRKKNHKKPTNNLPKKKKEIAPYLQKIAQQMGQLIYDGCTYKDDDSCYAAMYSNKKAKTILNDLLIKKSVIDENEKIESKFKSWQSFIRRLQRVINKKHNHKSKIFHGGDINQLISGFALAVSEQNAALKNVVTAPTNGSCGVVPATLYFYILLFSTKAERRWLFDTSGKVASHKLNNIVNFLLVANAIGGIIKNNASVSGGVGGCQAEIGTASAMAAGALMECFELRKNKQLKSFTGSTKSKEYTPSRVFNAASAALEHFLGSTCDPVGGLVEIPCIERNLVAVSTAISVAYEILGLHRDYEPKASFDIVVQVMSEIGKMMDTDLKETSRGGLALALEDDVKKARPDLFPEGQNLAYLKPPHRTGC